MNKKFLTRVVLATALVGGVNFLPMPNIEVGKVQIAVAYAESKNFAAKEAAMTDVEYIETQAKEASRMRAIEAVKEKIASYVRNFSGVKGKLSEDDVVAIAEKFEEVGTAKYKKLFYNAVDENGKELGKVGIMYEATVTAKFNSKKITEYIKLTEQEKERRIRQAREAREKFEELDREYEELRKNARTKTPEQLKSEIKNFDDKLSDLEKRKDKKSVTPKDKTATTENKPIINQPMQFSQPVKIGNASSINADFVTYKVEGAFYNQNGVAKFGTVNDFICFYQNGKREQYCYGSSNLKNTFPFTQLYGCEFTQIKTNNEITLYMVHEWQFTGLGEKYTLLGRKKDGTFVKYFDTWGISEQYFGKQVPENLYYDKCVYSKDTVTISFKGYRNNQISGVFRFKWDENAQWFSVEKVQHSVTESQAQSYLEIGENLYKSGKQREALEKYNQALALNPKLVDAYISRSVVLYVGSRTWGTNEYGVKATNDINRAIELSPNYARAYNWRAYMNLRKNPTFALNDINRAIQLDSQYLDAYETRAEIYSDMKKYDLAIADYTYILNNPNFKSSYMKHYDFDMMSDWAWYIDWNQRTAALYNGRGRAYYSNGDRDKAIDDFARALKLSPNNMWIGRVGESNFRQIIMDRVNKKI